MEKIQIDREYMELLTAENLRLREEVEYLKKLVNKQDSALIRDWLLEVGQLSDQMELSQTLSWRITRPLRALRRFQIKWRQEGFSSAVSAAARYLRPNSK